MKYLARCPSCGREEEYDSPITDPERNLPECMGFQDENSYLIHPDTKMEKIFVPNSGGFILKGPNWAKKGKAGY